jgi:CPA2 family monovalent cation:H+ antiporter-2
LSFALGAFLAGLVVSESDFDAQVLAEIIPLRDLFSTLFFVSLGMLLDVALFTHHPVQVAVVALVLVAGKAIISSASFLVANVNPVTATMAGLLTAQIGEFSFVLAGVGLDDHILSQQQYSLILAIALCSIIISPLAINLAPAMTSIVQSLPGVAQRQYALVEDDAELSALRRHVIICGYGRVGRTLGAALSRRGLQFVVIELNSAVVRDLVAEGIPVVYGDCTADAVLLRAGVKQARIVAITAPELFAALGTTRVAHRLNAGIEVVTRANYFGEVEELQAAGANQIVQPEFEAGLEFVRHVLRRQGVTNREVQLAVTRRRAQFYNNEDEESLYEERA